MSRSYLQTFASFQSALEGRGCFRGFKCHCFFYCSYHFYYIFGDLYLQSIKLEKQPFSSLPSDVIYPGDGPNVSDQLHHELSSFGLLSPSSSSLLNSSSSSSSSRASECRRHPSSRLLFRQTVELLFWTGFGDQSIDQSILRPIG